MPPAWIATWQSARCCIQSSKTKIDLHSFRYGFSGDIYLPFARRRTCLPVRHKLSSNSSGSFSTTTTRWFQPASQSQQNAPPRAPSELAFRRTDLRAYELKVVFGSNPPPLPLANSLLKTLHSRRVNGTLDIDLPSKFTSRLKPYPGAVDDALQWLRREYPLDEDAAILRRIEREEDGQGDEVLINRAESLGLYKPQSGVYGAKLGEEGDIFGESQLQKLRKANESKAQKEEEEVNEYVEQKQQAFEEKTGALEARKEDALEVSNGFRPPNVYERWKLKHYIAATSKQSFEEISRAGKLRRLLPSILFAGAVTYASYLFALTWTPPDRNARLMPSQPMSRATLFGIVGINLGIFVLWRFPPAWRILNRYFIVTTGIVRPLAHLGNIFSHQSLKHLAGNMIVLYLVGTTLHEQIGRGEFLALYIYSGVFGSVASLISMVLRGVLISSSLGASGAVSGIFAAFCMINPDMIITIWLLPEDLAKFLSCNAGTLLALAVVVEILSMTVPFLRRAGIDYVAHLGGYAMGIIGGVLWRRDHGGYGTSASRWGTNRSKEPRWYEKFLGR